MKVINATDYKEKYRELEISDVCTRFLNYPKYLGSSGEVNSFTVLELAPSAKFVRVAYDGGSTLWIRNEFAELEELPVNTRRLRNRR